MRTNFVKISDTNVEIIKQLQLSKISTKMRSIELSDWVVFEQIDDKIIGAAGMGGYFHSSSINVNENFRGKGYGARIQKELVKTAKKKNYSFVTVFVDPRNKSSQKMHDSVGYKTVFRIHYSKEIIQDVKIIILQKRGIVIQKFLKCFNSTIGMFFLGCFLKIFKNFFNNVIGYNEEKIPIPSIKHIVNNFEKI